MLWESAHCFFFFSFLSHGVLCFVHKFCGGESHPTDGAARSETPMTCGGLVAHNKCVKKKKRLCSELILICFVLFFLYPNFACSSASLLLNLAVYPSVSRIFVFCFGYQCRLHCAKACFVTFSFIAFESPPPFLGVVFSQLMSVSFTSISHDLLPAMSRRLLC